MICWYLFATEEGPFTMRLTLKNQQRPIYGRGHESLLYQHNMCTYISDFCSHTVTIVPVVFSYTESMCSCRSHNVLVL